MIKKHSHNFKDLTGKVFGRLIAEMYQDNDKQGSANWLCQCSCGKMVVVPSRSLIHGNTKSCGCFSREDSRMRFVKHGDAGKKTRLYNIWVGMRNRCLNENNHKYKVYGGRGIIVCSEWSDFVVFKEWALKNGYEEALSIERVDVNGNYEPKNCTWIPLEDQAKNRRKRD